MKKSTIALLSVLAFSSAHAAEGRIELSQVCAENFGCTSGDTAGFPITINQSGSYVLTSDLVTTSTSTNVIEVTADYVDIDLNGFRIMGPASCSGNGPTCSGTGSGTSKGIYQISSKGLTVHDGTIVGMASDAISASNGAKVYNMTLRGNGGNGIAAAYAIVQDSIIMENGKIGFVGQGKMDNCLVVDNGDYGVAGLLSYISLSNNYFISNAGSNASNPNTTNAVLTLNNQCSTSAAISPTFCP